MFGSIELAWYVGKRSICNSRKVKLKQKHFATISYYCSIAISCIFVTDLPVNATEYDFFKLTAAFKNDFCIFVIDVI